MSCFQSCALSYNKVVMMTKMDYFGVALSSLSRNFRARQHHHEHNTMLYPQLRLRVKMEEDPGAKSEDTNVYSVQPGILAKTSFPASTASGPAAPAEKPQPPQELSPNLYTPSLFVKKLKESETQTNSNSFRWIRFPLQQVLSV